MAVTIKTNWAYQDKLTPTEVNRIEGNIQAVDSTVAAAKSAADEARVIAEGRSRALVFDTAAQLDAWIAGTYTRPDEKTITDLLPGDSLLIVELDVPDYWWDGAQKQVSEAEKVDLTDYPKTAEVQSMIAALANNLLQKNNTAAFTPTADYHPATKKYVDDNKSLDLPPNDGNVYGILNGQYVKITGAVWYDGM